MKENNIEHIIGIGGGVGPMAGVKLHEKIIENTETDHDQGHLEIHHLSRSHDIPDRTKFLLGEGQENPAEGMLRTVKAMEKTAEVVGKKMVLGVPCNTFHAPKIFNHFLELLAKKNIEIQVINMIKETGAFIKESFPNAKKIGLMSTTGTRQVGVYNEVLEPLGFKIEEVQEEMQGELHDSIYNKEWGIKAKTPVSEHARNNFLKYADVLTKQGAEAIILGCTEIPLALPEQNIKGMPLIDPVLVLARALIREANIKKLKPLNKQ